MKKGYWMAALACLGMGMAVSPIFAEGYTKASLTDFAGQVSEKMEEVRGVYHKAERACQGAKAASSTPQDPAYASLAQAVEGLKKPMAALEADLVQVNETNRQIKSLYKESRVIESSDPRWKQVQALAEELKKGGSAFQNDGNAFNSAAHKYVEQANQAGIGEEKTAKVLKEMGEKMANRAEKMEKLRVIVKKAGRLKLAGEGAQRVADMERRMKKSEEAWKECRVIVAEFKKNASGKEFIYGGPGIQPITSLNDLSDRIENLKRWSGQIKEDWAALKSDGERKKEDSEN